MERIRRPFQGVANVVRFNWPLYLLSLGLAAFLPLVGRVLEEPYRAGAGIAGLLLAGAAVLSLLVSFYIYDLSGLYRLAWAGECPAGARIVNVHAGFDETSALLRAKFPGCELVVLDFFDPKRHTEASIRRARRACRPFPGTQSISTADIHLKLIGVLLIALALLHAVFPAYFRWSKDLAGLQPINRQMMYVHAFFIALAILLMGVLCLTCSPEIAGTPLGRKVACGFAVFWAARLLVQFFGYSASLWRGKKFETAVHVVFTVFWIYLATIFSAIAWAPPRTMPW